MLVNHTLKTKLATAAAVVVLVAGTSVASANSKHARAHRSFDGWNAYAQVQGPFVRAPAFRRNPAFRRSQDVYRNGSYIGSDPDPLVRDEMRRDHLNTGD